jgi:hypothetical protein
MSSLSNELATLLQAAATGTSATKKVDWTGIDTQVKHEGKEIKLPAEPGNMPIADAIRTLEQVQEQENQKFDANERIMCAPWDGLTAVYKAMQNIYGVVLAQSKKTFFGEILPDMVTVHTGPGAKDRVQVPMGQMGLPGVSAPVTIGIQPWGVYIAGKVRKRDRAILVEIINEAKRILREDSIYRGKAIRLGVDSDGDLNTHEQPEFLDLAKVQESDMIHSAETAAQIRTSILAPLKHTEACRRNKVPLKRGVLLEGKYGTGKSLTARVTAKVATDNGWTFIMLNRSQGLKTAIEFARAYQPCVIFAEDIDRAADRENEDVNDLVNLLDGLITKDMEMMVVLTTNFIEKIDRALLRPGRFDAIVSIQPPDADAAERLVRHYAGPLLDTQAELGLARYAIQGWIPATIREVVERAKLSMLVEEREAITSEDLIVAAVGMQRHMELLNPVEVTSTPESRLYAAFKELVGAGVNEGLGGEEGIENLPTAEAVNVIDQRVQRLTSRANDLRDQLSATRNDVQSGASSAQMAMEHGLRIRQKIGA